MKSIYLTPFVFRATRYEEYKDGICINHQNVDIQIISKVINNCAMFHLEGNMPMNMKRNFGLPVFGVERGDILEDRIMYGRLPDNFSWQDPTDPLVCCLRRAKFSQQHRTKSVTHESAILISRQR
jgi:hypothetical protein